MIWFVLQVASGQEMRVRHFLQSKRLTASVPREICQIRRGGRWHEKEKTLMPGYVFLGIDETELSPEAYYTAMKAPGVIRFLGIPKPQPISEAEAAHLALLAPTDEPLAPSVVRRADGQVLSGPLLQLSDQIVKLDKHRRRAKVRLSMMGEEKTINMSIKVEGAKHEDTDAAAAGQGIGKTKATAEV